jgi:hypothetical protein
VRKPELARKRKRESIKEKFSPTRGKRNIESDKKGLAHIAKRGYKVRAEGIMSYRKK